MHYDDDPHIITRETHTEVTRTSSSGLTAAAVIFAAMAALGVIWMVTMDNDPAPPAPTVILPIPSEPKPSTLPPLVMAPIPDPNIEADKRALEKATQDAKKATQEARDAAKAVTPAVPVPQPEVLEVPHD